MSVQYIKRASTLGVYTLFCIALSGCGDFFYQDVDLGIRSHTGKMVLNSLIANDMEKVEMLLTRSLPMEDSSAANKPLLDASVEFFVNGELVGFAVYNDTIQRYETDYRTQPGNCYRVVVKHRDFETVSGETCMPGKPGISGAKFGGKRYSEDGFEHRAVTFTLTDIPGVNNFYEVFIYKVIDGERTHELYVTTPYSWTEFTPLGVGFSDAIFSDKEIEMEIWLDYYAYSSDEWNTDKDISYHLVVRAVSKAYYYYMVTYEKHIQNREPGLFSGEPVMMYSNIKGGYGIFGAFSEEERSIN